MKKKLNNLLAKGKVQQVITQLEELKNLDKDLSQQVVLLSFRFTQNNLQQNYGTVEYHSACIENNKISAALLALINNLPDNIHETEIENFSTYKIELQKSLDRALVDHGTLFGVDHFLIFGKKALGAARNSWILSIFGEGGIGKTALAFELLKQFGELSGFTRFAWVSAKPFSLSTSQNRMTTITAHLNWADLVNDLATQLQLDVGLSRNEWLANFPKAIRKLSIPEKCLMVIDNLETIEDTEVVAYLITNNILNPNKVIITTRKSISDLSDSVAEIPVSGLNKENSINYIRHIGSSDNTITSAPDAAFDGVFKLTEGNPLLIKLVINRFLIQRKPLQMILDELIEINSENEIIAIDYIYSKSLAELQQRFSVDIADNLMSAFCDCLPSRTHTYQQLLYISEIDDKKKFGEALQYACKLSLIRFSGLNGQYSIHSLLWNYLCNE